MPDGFIPSLSAFVDSGKRTIKQKLADILGNPLPYLQQTAGQVNEDAKSFNRTSLAAALGDPMAKSKLQSSMLELASNGIGAGTINWPKSPKTLYHGSAEPFERFDRSLLGSNTRANDAHVGFHFSDNKADASLYADMAARAKLLRDEPWSSPGQASMARGVVRPFDLEMKNPLVIGLDKSSGNAGPRTEEFLRDKMAAKLFADENGYDGIVYPHGTNVDSGYTAIAFSPDQITSITPKTKSK